MRKNSIKTVIMLLVVMMLAGMNGCGKSDEAYQQMLQQQNNKNNGTDIKPGTDNSGDNNGNNGTNDNNNGSSNVSLVVTVTPATTAAPTATSIPLPTPTPKQIPTSTPTCTPTCTLTPTATLTPTSTPIPTPVMSDEAVSHKYYTRQQVGDNIWVEIYEDGTVRVTGTGKTWDFETAAKAIRNKQESKEYKLLPSDWVCGDIIIDEGITYIGSYSVIRFDAKTVTIPSTVKEINSAGFHRIGNDATVWFGLNDGIKLHDNAFSSCMGIGLAELEETTGKNLLAVPTPTCTPTPTATPTPFPKADPANPILLFTDKPYDNITVEVWDNGYAYVKGSGDFDAVAWDYWGFTMRKMGDNRKALTNVVTHLIIEEGITSLGKYTLDFADSKNMMYIQVPSTLKECDINSLQGSGDDVDVFEFNLGGKTVYFDQAQQRKDKQIFESANAYVQVGRIINVEMFGVNGFDIGFADEKYLYR